MNYTRQTHWTSTRSNRLLVDVGMTYVPVSYNLGFEPGTVLVTISQHDIVTSTILKITPRAESCPGRASSPRFSR